MNARAPRAREGALWRRAAAWGAQKWPEWFVRSAPVVIGFFFALVLSRPRRLVGRNLEWVRGRVGSARQLRDVIATFVAFARALTAALAPERPIFKNRTVDLVGEEHVRPFLDRRQGMLMLTAHVGPWDACALRLRSMMDVPVMMLMSHEGDVEAQEFQDGVRGSTDVEVLRVGRRPLEIIPLLDHVRAGGVVVAQLDRVPPGVDSIEVSLFERPFAVPSGLFRIAGVLGCPIFPVFSARLDENRDRVVVHPAVQVPRRANSVELRKVARTVVRAFESHLRNFPTQWFHFVEDA